MIASPVYEEMVKNYRREVLLARALASRGVAVQRFHYRGAGHSDGESRALTFDSMLEDLGTATEHLQRRTDASRLAIMGTRLGGLLAMVGNVNRFPVVLWEPVIDASAYFRELGRLRSLHSVVSERRRRPTISEELERDGSVDILGYEVTRRMTESCDSYGVSSAPLPEAALLVQLRRRSTLAPDYRSLIESWQRCEVQVETLVEVNGLPWWFETDDPSAPHRWLDSPPSVATTREWIVRTLVGRGQAPSDATE